MKGEVIVKGAPSAKFIVNGNTGAKYNVDGMGGVRGPKGEKGDPGAGLSISGSVNTYSELPSNLTESDAGTAYFVQADGKLYVWSGSSWPADGDGAQFQGPAGPAGKDGPQGPAGTNATITGATASVTNTTGTPSVTVTAGGTERARSFNFAFTNLKGDKGDTGAGLPTTGGGNNEVLVSGPNGGTDASWGKVTQNSMANNSVGTSQLINSSVTSDKIDWSSTSRPIYYTGTNWARSWTFNYDSFSPQLIFVAWENSTAMFARIWDTIYKVFQNGGRTVTSSIDTTNHTWTLSTDNTGVISVLELRNTKTGE